MSDTNTPPPADAAREENVKLLRILADEQEGVDYACSIGQCRDCGTTIQYFGLVWCDSCRAARLRALAEVLEREEQEQRERAASDARLRTAALERLR